MPRQISEVITLAKAQRFDKLRSLIRDDDFTRDDFAGDDERDLSVTIPKDVYDDLQAKARRWDDVDQGDGDRLATIMAMQFGLMERLGYLHQSLPADPKTLALSYLPWLYKHVGELCTCVAQEAAELRDWTPWKHWSKQLGNKIEVDQGSPEHLAELDAEIIDLLHFVLELAIVRGMDAEAVLTAYERKNAVNHKRQQQGDY